MSDNKDSRLSYSQAGVDIERGNLLVEQIKPAVASTKRTGVISDIGGFGGLFALSDCGFEDPILVSATDGVGTKLRLAITTGIHRTVGIDLVAMCVNDIVVQGAEPLFFLDYFASGKLDTQVATEVVSGIADGCKLAGAALIGGETAEMPDMYADKDYDLAGFCVGAVERNEIIDGSDVSAGDIVVGLASDGIHSNGYSLVRHVLEKHNIPLETEIAGSDLKTTLMRPTRIYVKPVLSLIREVDIKAIAHITGGGITENLPRVLPAGVGAEINLDSWELPAVFSWLRDCGPIDEDEMLKTFNCGIGLILIVASEHADYVLEQLQQSGEEATVIGQIIDSADKSVRYRGHID